MAKSNKSAKDIAFDKEREKFRSEIRNLKHQINDKDKKIVELEEKIRQKEEEIEKINEWNERLLEYTEISKEDLKKLIESEKENAEVREKMSATLGILGMFGRNFI